MTASLAADGLVSLVPALAIMLGANVGTTLIVQLLSFNISAVAPVLFVIGLVTFRVGGTSLTRALGRIAIGLGLTLLALISCSTRWRRPNRRRRCARCWLHHRRSRDVHR